MKKILITGLPASGVTLITKMLAKKLSESKKVLIQDLSVTASSFGNSCVGDVDKRIGTTEYDDVDITNLTETPSEEYDLCLTEATITESDLDKEMLSSFDEIVIVVSDDMNRSKRTESFIKNNDLKNLKLVVNLAYLGKLNFDQDIIDYITYISMDTVVHAIDRRGDAKGLILLKKMPKDFRKQIEKLAEELCPSIDEELKGFMNRLMRRKSKYGGKDGMIDVRA